MRKSLFPRLLNVKNNLLFVVAFAAVSWGSCQAQTAQDLGVQEQSAFDVSPGARDPFLPIGWQRPPDSSPVESGVPATAPAETLLKPEMFVVSSISVDHIRLAVINGKLYSEGEAFTFLVEGKQQVKMRVFKIQDGMVTLGCNSVRLACPLRLSSPQKTDKKP